MSQRLEDWEITKYWEIFSGLNPVDGKLSGARVATVFRNSQLTDSQLEKVWDLSDIDMDSNLDFEEFCIAMRLIFDLVNGNTQSLPNKLPEWLVPSSKAHLIAANQALATGDNQMFRGGNSSLYDDDDDDDELGLSSDFDWYISPNDKTTYDDVYMSACDRFGRITFNSLNGLYGSLSVPDTDIRSAWNLVNPKSHETIDKDQCHVFLHILNQRESGKRVPRSVPPSLRATFEKEVPEYDINSHQADIHTSHSTGGNAFNRNNNKKLSVGAASSKKNAFADNYLNRLGGGSTHSNDTATHGTDFSATQDTDWEEVRLRRRLKDLEDLMEKAEQEAKHKIREREDRENGIVSSSASKNALIRNELEHLLDYKTNYLTTLKTGSASIGAGSNRQAIEDVESEIQEIEGHVKNLEEFKDSRQEELNGLLAQIQAERASARA